MTSNPLNAFKKQKRKIILAGVLMAASIAAGITAPLLVMKMVGGIITAKLDSADIGFYLVLIFLLLAAKGVLYGISLAVSHIGAYQALADIRLLLVEHLKRLPLGFFEKRRAGELTKIVNHDVEQIELYLAHGLPELFATAAVPPLILLAVFIIDWRIGLAAVALLPIVFLILALLSRAWQQIIATYNKVLTEMSAGLMEFIAAIPVIKAYSREEERSTRLGKMMAAYKEWSVRQTLAFVVPVGVTGILVEGGLALIVVVGSLQLMGGCITVDEFLIAVILGLGFYGTLTRLFFISSSNVSQKNSLQNIGSILAAKPPKLPAIKRQPARYDIEFRDVSFGYEEGVTVLKEISIKIPQHSLTAIVGKSGSGKSTIANLIMRFWVPQQGEITIGGCPVEEFKEEELAKMISMVHQDVYLFNTTIAENIRLGRQGATDHEVEEAARCAQLHGFICSLPQGYQTLVGEKGSRLSGGEKQRLAIARAILKNAPIVILDEATASVDPYNEKLIHEAVSHLTHNKTLIVIAHHLNTITGADQIIVLDEGRVVACGTHEQLLDTSELYKQMWQDQECIDRWGLRGENGEGAVQHIQSDN